jgi:hypothetical protein
MSSAKGFLLVVLFSWLGTATPPTASAQAGQDSVLVYSGNPVTITLLASDAFFTSRLYLFRTPVPGDSLRCLMDNRAGTPPDEVMFDPGSEFGIQPGRELVFGIYVEDTDKTYFIGPAARNGDDLLHARIERVSSQVYDVGFEDSEGGGDQDYNDLRFRFAGVGVTSTLRPTWGAMKTRYR